MTVKGAKQTPPNNPLALKDLSTKKSTFSLWVTLKERKFGQRVKTSKSSKLFLVFCFEKKFLKNHCIAEKFLSKMTFKEKSSFTAMKES